MSESIVSKLQTAVSQLTHEENQLSSQLAALKEQRQGLQTVINMFTAPASNHDTVAPPEHVETTEVVKDTLSISASKVRKTSNTSAKSSSKSTPSPKATSKSRRTPGQKPTVKAESASPKPTRKTRSSKSPNWSRYIQDPFKKTPLPDVVANILKSQPEQTFKIADVMEIIFKKDTPKATFLKARNRVSNILSAGARTREWSRGRGGRYSLSEKALAS